MAAKIFLSYRREDSAGYAGRLQDRLVKEFGRQSVFLDVEDLRAGTNYPEVLLEEIGKCEVFLALMGERWREALADKINRCSVDFFRLEIGTAPACEVTVIPIFLDDAPAPQANELPEDLKELARRNGRRIRHESFDNDMSRLIEELEGTSENLKAAKRKQLQQEIMRYPLVHSR